MIVWNQMIKLSDVRQKLRNTVLVITSTKSTFVPNLLPKWHFKTHKQMKKSSPLFQEKSSESLKKLKT